MGMGVNPKIDGFYSQIKGVAGSPPIIHLFIRFSLIFTHYYGVSLFLETPIYNKKTQLTGTKAHLSFPEALPGYFIRVPTVGIRPWPLVV